MLYTRMFLSLLELLIHSPHYIIQSSSSDPVQIAGLKIHRWGDHGSTERRPWRGLLVILSPIKSVQNYYPDCCTTKFMFNSETNENNSDGPLWLGNWLSLQFLSGGHCSESSADLDVVNADCRENISAWTQHSSNFTVFNRRITPFVREEDKE